MVKFKPMGFICKEGEVVCSVLDAPTWAVITSEATVNVDIVSFS